MTRLDCDEAMAHLHDYLKQELTPELIVEVQTHLERCRDCADYARFEQAFLEKLGGCAGKVTCPNEVRARIMAALRAASGGS
jgi:anti-sigma factor (TIGR02949 family)